MTSRVCSLSAITLILVTHACASAPPPAPLYPELLEAQAQSAMAPTPKPPPAAKSAKKSAPQSKPSTEPSPASDGLRKASRPPVELLTNSNATFILNFNESDAGKTAKEQCEQSDSSRDEITACLQKARAKISIESLRFIKKGGEYWWVTLNRYKGNLLKWHVIQFQVGEEKSDWVALKPFGKDKGIAPMARIPRKLEIELPNDFTIVMKDPEFGKLTFDAKIGLFDE